MASLRTNKAGKFLVCFRVFGKQFNRDLATENEKEASARQKRVESIIHDIETGRLVHWKATVLERMHTLFQEDDQASLFQLRVAELEQLVGKQAYEIEILKKSCADAPWSSQSRRKIVMKLAKDYPIRLVGRLLDVPRSTLYYAAQPVPDDEAMLKSANP